jgi:fructose/tagatose bisphosphate aldolase
MELWNSVEALKTACKGSFEIDKGAFKIADEKRFRNETVDRLIWNAVFSGEEPVRKTSRWAIWEASQALGCPSSSINDFYMARSKESWKDQTVPAINLRGMTYDIARTIFKMLMRINSGTCLFEIAKSEIDYTKQRPSEYAACILAAAIREGWHGPVFIQGDHFQANAKKFQADPDSEIASLKSLIKEAIEAGFYNIDIDTSTLVDLSKPTVFDQQRANFETAAELTKHIRSLEPKGVTVSVGGEIGEVGGKNSTTEELTAFVEGFNGVMSLGTKKSPTGLSKISIQTGTTHGGVVLADGSIAKVKLDFDTLEELGKVAREQFGLGGVVQHGASTLPESAFDNFPKRQTLEVHLATAFQNTLYESTALPSTLRENIYKWLKQDCAKEKTPDQTEEQFYYKTRKKGFGPFKKEMWSLTDNTKSALMSELAKTFDMMFKKLGIVGNRKLVDQHIKTAAVHHKPPAE